MDIENDFLTILILPKNPFPEKSRWGSKELQDFWHSCAKAAMILDENQNPESKILLITNFQTNEGNEADYFSEILIDLDVDYNKIKVIREGVETLEQLLTAKYLVENDGSKLLIVCTFLHFLRVRWICWMEEIEARFKVAFGLPEPKNAVMNIILTAVYPILDLLGCSGWFQNLVIKRREKGKI